jgi:monoamine oxidase
LKKQNVRNFVILEAKDYIGGRAHTVMEEWEGKNVPIDLGAMWIQNGANNLLTYYAKKYNIKSSVSKFKTRLYKKNNAGPMDDDEYDELSTALYDDGFYGLQAHRQQNVLYDEPLKHSEEEFTNSLQIPMGRDLVRHFIRDAIEFEYSASTEEMSLKYWNSDSYIGGEACDDSFVDDGYSSLVQAYANDQGVMGNVILEAAVSRVNYDDNDIVRIDYVKNNTDKTIYTRRVIITIPLGVLQHGLVKFVPPLPTSTSRSIHRLGMGKMNKIFMFWKSDDVFWPSLQDYEVFSDVTNRASNFMFYNSLSFGGEKPVLYAFYKGSTVEDLEKKYAKSDEEMYMKTISELAMSSLRSMFGNDIPNPEKVVCTCWNVDEHCMGAYSFNKVGMKVADRQVLRSPIAGNRIIISGEATHDNYPQTTTGAFLAGRDAAKKMVNSLRM